LTIIFGHTNYPKNKKKCFTNTIWVSLLQTIFMTCLNYFHLKHAICQRCITFNSPTLYVLHSIHHLFPHSITLNEGWPHLFRPVMNIVGWGVWVHWSERIDWRKVKRVMRNLMVAMRAGLWSLGEERVVGEGSASEIVSSSGFCYFLTYWVWFSPSICVCPFLGLSLDA
jgi:hypothetical protein